MNLVSLPDSMDSVSAASLGCRFAWVFRALEAKAMGARIIALDIQNDKLDMAL
jgi:D-arabinose 1-dehydrogenase-like Zn-dependent alcohol dehydrogenase